MHILVVEDEIITRLLMKTSLAEAGHVVSVAGSAEAALALIETTPVDSFLLDVMLPGTSGMELCRQLRAKGVKAPILFLTALSSLKDKIEGLDAGAHDYLTKPFEMAELLARVRAMDRLARGYPKPTLCIADLVLDPNNRTVERAGKTLVLTPKEFDLLALLAKNPGVIIGMEQVLKEVWGLESPPQTNLVTVCVSNLRKKIDADRSRRLIHTVRKGGLVLRPLPPL